MDKELKEKLRSMSATIHSGFFLTIAMIAFFGMKMIDDDQRIFWAFAILASAIFCLITIGKDVYDTVKYHREKKIKIKEELKNG